MFAPGPPPRPVTAGRAGRASLLAVGIALSSGGAALAQAVTAPPGGPQMSSASDRFSADVYARATYDSNVSGGDTAIASLRRLEPSDVYYSVGTTFAFQLPSSRASLFLMGSADVRRYERNTTLNGEDYQISAGATGRLGFCAATAVASYAQRQSLVEDLAVAVATNVVELPSARVGVNCAEGRIVQGVSAYVERQINQEKRAGFVDSQTQGGSASVGYRNPVLGQLSLTAIYSKVDYDNPTASSLATLAAPSFQQYGGGLQYTRKFGMRLSGTAEITYSHLESRATAGSLNSQGLDANSLGGNATLAYRLTPRIHLTLNYDLSNQASPILNTNYVRAETLEFSADYVASQRISFHGSVDRVTDDYRGGQVTVLQVRNSDQTTIAGGVGVKVGRKVMLTLDLAHTERNADISQFDFNSNRVTLGVTGTF
jgi:putative beta-barrel porin BBP2